MRANSEHHLGRQVGDWRKQHDMERERERERETQACIWFYASWPGIGRYDTIQFSKRAIRYDTIIFSKGARQYDTIRFNIGNGHTIRYDTIRLVFQKQLDDTIRYDSISRSVETIRYDTINEPDDTIRYDYFVGRRYDTIQFLQSGRLRLPAHL